MFAKNSKAYSVYLLFRFVCSLAVSMSTVLSIVYHLEVVQLDAFQLVLVGTVLETSCFLFEMPTGVVADLYSRRRSVLIGMFLYGLGFLMEGALPWFAPVLLAQVVWGCGDTFITGALEAWIASEEEDKPIDKVFLRGSQMGQIGGVLGVVLGTLLGNINLQMPVILGGSLCLLLGLVMVRIMPETNFSPAIEERQGLLKDFVCLFKLNLGFVKGAPVLLALLAITLCGGLASEGFDRLSTAHFLDDTVIPVIGPLNSVTWFGVISLIGSGLGILASQLLIARMEKKGFHTIGALKTNRLLYPSGMKKKLRELAAELSVTHREFDLVTVKKRNYYVYRYEGNLNGIENAVVLLSYPEKAFGNPKALRAFISTNAALSTQEILSWYVCRWPIEVFFRQCKDKLALDSYQIRSAQGIKRYWLLMSLAHFMCAVGTGRFCSFETGYHEICDTIQLEKYRYLFQCAKESNDFDSFMKFAV